MDRDEEPSNYWWKRIKYYAPLAIDERCGVMLEFEDAYPQKFAQLVADAPQWTKLFDRQLINLSLVAKAVGVADGELIKNRLGTDKLIYFECISGKLSVPYVSKININLDPRGLMINRFANFIFINFFASAINLIFSALINTRICNYL